MKRNWWPILAVALAVLVGGLLRLHRLDSVPPGLHADEATDGNDALQAWRSGQFKVFYPENFGREGLMINLQAVALGVTGIFRPWMLRLPGAILGTLTVLGVYLLARQWGLERAGWLAAWFVAVSFWQIDVSRMGTRVVGAPFFLVWSFWLWGMAARTGDRWLIWAVLAGIFYGLGFYTYTAFRITPVLVFFLWRRCPRKVNIVASVVALVVVLPLAVYAVAHPAEFTARLQALPGVANSAGNFWQNMWKTITMFHFNGDLNPRHNLPGAPMLFWPVGILFLVGLAVAVRRQPVLIVWFFLGLLPAILASEGVPHSWRAIVAAPAAFLLAALGVEWCLEKSEATSWRAFRPAALVALALILAIQGYRSYFVDWARNPHVAEWFDSSVSDIADQLGKQPRDLPKYVIFEPDVMNVRGLPIAAQTIMFLTDTATAEKQAAMNLHYLRIDQTNQVARGYVYVAMIETVHP